MHLARLNLVQFRCFASLRVPLEAGVTLFHGDNAQGKTSILEAVCVLLRLQSPRCPALGECVRFSETAFGLSGWIERAEPAELKLQFQQGTRKLSVDGETQKSATAYLQHSALVVWMANDDLALVRGGGEGRRRYLDFMASQLFPDFRSASRAYEQALKSRNFLLKRDASPRWAEIDAFTRILDANGRVITRCRRELVSQLAGRAGDIQRFVAGREESLTMEYASASGPEDDLLDHLRSRREEEMRRRQTVAGPHRDDLLLSIDGRPAGKFASEGQQRTVALALKLGQARLFEELKSVPPVMLIDDVFGELDPGRRNALMAAWPPASQKLITTTHLDWLDGRFHNTPRFLVREAGLVL